MASVVEAFERNEIVLDYLWAVAEAMDDGVAVDDVITGIFDGDASRLMEVRSLTEQVWRDAGGSELASRPHRAHPGWPADHVRSGERRRVLTPRLT